MILWQRKIGESRNSNPTLRVGRKKERGRGLGLGLTFARPKKTPALQAKYKGPSHVHVSDRRSNWKRKTKLNAFLNFDFSFFLLGRLHKYCRADEMPQETCFMECNSCVKYGGIWCPKGHVVVWINGVRLTNFALNLPLFTNDVEPLSLELKSRKKNNLKYMLCSNEYQNCSHYQYLITHPWTRIPWNKSENSFTSLQVSLKYKERLLLAR